MSSTEWMLHTHLTAEEQFLCIVATVMVLVLLGAVLSLRRLRLRVRALETRDRESATGNQPGRRAEQDLAFVADFVREFPQLLLELQSQTEVRRIPTVLLEAMIRCFKAEQAVVMVRRKAVSSRPELGNRLVVAALASAERQLRVGTEIRFGEGQLGLVAEAQRVMDRQDFEPESGLSHKGLGARGELMFDVVAPMIIGEDTVGVIGLSRPARQHPRQKEMLQAIAQLGALAWHNLTTYRSVKIAAEIDELTGIFNKAALKLRLSELVFEARARGVPVAVFMFDIDNFKSYNDLNGHLAGDQLLRALAELVRESVRSDDTFGRFGGEEFLLVMSGRSREQALSAAETVRQRIAGHDFPYRRRQPLGVVSVSGGVALFPDDAGDVVELLQSADQALYRAKAAGRNRVFAAETGLNPSRR